MEIFQKGRRLVIGDIHGCKRTFAKLLKKVKFSTEDTLYILGDMIDRGPDSKGVLKRVIKLRNSGYKIIAIRGNHEQMLLDVIENEPENLHSFLIIQKSTSLLNKKGELKAKFLEFLKACPYYVKTGNFILAHAALDLANEDIFENKEFMISSRYQRGNSSRLESKQFIHGHIAMNLKIIKSSISEKHPIIDIDNGCIYGDSRPGFGKLLCLNLETMELYSQKNCEKPPQS